MNKRGSVLLHVLVTGALLALIAGTLLRMALLRYQVTVHTTLTNQERRSDEAALNMVIGAWNSVNTACSQPAVLVNYNCTPASAVPPGNCGCTCSPTGTALAAKFPTLIAGGGAPPCTLTIGQTNDLQKTWDGW
jgi:hypothetical protein